MKVGNSSLSKTLVEVQIKCDKINEVQLALAEIYDLCEENDIVVSTKDYKGHFEDMNIKDGYDSS
jgi:hypothetical protein